MRRQQLLAPALAAALAAVGVSSLQAATTSYGKWQRDVAEPAKPVSRDQVARELAQAREAGWQGYGSEVTLDPQAAPAGVMSREQVMAEFREWRDAGALAEGSEAGPSQATLDRRVALHNRQVEQYALAIETEQRRLAQIEAERQRLAQLEAERRAAEQQAAAAAPGTSPTDSTASPAATSAVTSTTTGSGTPAPAPTEPAPAAPGRDAAVDTTRPRDDTTAQPNPVR